MTSLRPCPSCERQIAADARSCPGCGTHLSSSWREFRASETGRSVIVLAEVLVVVGVVVLCVHLFS